MDDNGTWTWLLIAAGLVAGVALLYMSVDLAMGGSVTRALARAGPGLHAVAEASGDSAA